MLVISLSRVLQFLLLLLTLRLSTEFLTPVDIGMISLVTSTVGLFALFLINPIGMYVNRRLYDWIMQGAIYKYLKMYWAFLFSVNIIAALAIYLLNIFDIWKPNIQIGFFILIICGNLTFTTVNHLYMSMINMMGRIGWFAGLTVATFGVSLLTAVVLIHLITPNAQYWLIGLLFGQLLIGVLGRYIFVYKINYLEIDNSVAIRLNLSSINRVISYAWPIAIAVALGWMQSQGYRYVMEYKISLVELGIFVAGFGISVGLMSGIETILTNYFQPIFYSKISQEKDDGINIGWVEYMECMLPPLWLTTVFIILMAPVLTQILLGENFVGSRDFIVWGAISEFGRVATAAVGMASHARMKTIYLITPNLVGAVFASILLVPMINQYGSIGVGMTLVMASFLSFFTSIIVTKRYLDMIPSPKIIYHSFVYSVSIVILWIIVSSLVDYKDSKISGLVHLLLVGLFYLFFLYLLLKGKVRSKLVGGYIIKKTA